MYLKPDARLAIYAEGEFGKGRSKTAEGVLRYGKHPIAAVIDSTAVGKTILEAAGIDCPAPIVASLDEALKYKPDALLLGTQWVGGALPEQWRPELVKAILAKLDIVNGLHDFLCDDPQYSKLAQENNVRLLDVRKPPAQLPIAEGKARLVKALTVLTVGTDCSVGKMTVSLELLKEAERRGFKARFVATGQTGIMITGGFGIAIDRVIGDFMAGATEQLVLEAAPDQDFVFVEGQGSLAHPSFSGVTLALMHGSAAKAMVLCHKSSRSCINNLPEFPQPDFRKMIEISQTLAAFVQPSKVVAIALNTRGLSDEQAQQAIKEAESQTGLPAGDPVRFGAQNLFDAVLAFQEKLPCLAQR